MQSGLTPMEKSLGFFESASQFQSPAKSAPLYRERPRMKRWNTSGNLGKCPEQWPNPAKPSSKEMVVARGQAEVKKEPPVNDRTWCGPLGYFFLGVLTAFLMATGGSAMVCVASETCNLEHKYLALTGELAAIAGHVQASATHWATEQANWVLEQYAEKTELIGDGGFTFLLGEYELPLISHWLAVSSSPVEDAEPVEPEPEEPRSIFRIEMYPF